MSSFNGGCLGKVDLLTLTTLLEKSQGLASSPFGFVDADIMDLPAAANALATSIDLIYDFGLGPGHYGYIAATHAMSDIYATLATPLSLTVCLGAPPQRLVDGSAAEILSGVQSAAATSKCRMAGGHTVFSDSTFVAVSVVGFDPFTTGVALDSAHAYDLMLSKPLGSGVYIAAARNQLLHNSDMTELTELLRESNSHAAATLVEAARSAPGSIGFVTDVTGFGLLVALQTKVPTGWLASVSQAQVPMMSRTMDLIENHGLITRLGEQTMLSTLGSVGSDRGALDVAIRLALCDPQTSGGLLAAVSHEVADSLARDAVCAWRSIGTLRAVDAAGGPTVIIS